MRERAASGSIVPPRCKSARRRAALTVAAITPAAFAAGCWLMALQLAPMGLHTLEAVTVATGNAVTGRDITRDNEDEGVKCDQLVSAMPYVAEVRRTAEGGLEIRQWGLSAAAGKPQWKVIPGKHSTAEGWRPEPNLTDLNFTPPLQTVLAASRARYLIFAPLQANDAGENEQMVSFISAFGPADGMFSWRGRPYKYAVSKTLPCFASAS